MVIRPLFKKSCQKIINKTKKITNIIGFITQKPMPL